MTIIKMDEATKWLIGQGIMGIGLFALGWWIVKITKEHKVFISELMGQHRIERKESRDELKEIAKRGQDIAEKIGEKIEDYGGLISELNTLLEGRRQQRK